MKHRHQNVLKGASWFGGYLLKVSGHWCVYRVNTVVDKELVKHHVLPVLRNLANQPAMHARLCALSQGQDSRELFQGREHHRYELAC